MSKPEIDLPEHVKVPLRGMILAEVGIETLDDFEIGLFEWYAKETEAFLNQMLASELAYIQEQVSTGGREINDSGVVAVEYYTKRIRYSHVIYLTSLLETCLARACTDLTLAVGEENIPFGLPELRGDQWSKKQKFLERYGNFELPKELWSEIRVLISVRNCLVHENGNTEKLRDDQRNALRKRPGIDIEGYEFKIEEAYIRHAFQAVKLFVQAVEGQLVGVIRRANHTESGA